MQFIVHRHKLYQNLISLTIVFYNFLSVRSNVTSNSTQNSTNSSEANYSTASTPIKGDTLTKISSTSTSTDYEVLKKDYTNFLQSFGFIIGASLGGIIILISITIACICWKLQRRDSREKIGNELTDNEHLKRTDNSFPLANEKQVVLLKTSDLIQPADKKRELHEKMRNESEEDEGVHSVDEEELSVLQQHTLLKAPRRPKPPTARRLPAKYMSYFEKNTRESNQMRTSKSMPESARLNEDSSSSDYLSRSDTFDSELLPDN